MLGRMAGQLGKYILPRLALPAGGAALGIAGLSNFEGPSEVLGIDLDKRSEGYDVDLTDPGKLKDQTIRQRIMAGLTGQDDKDIIEKVIGRKTKAIQRENRDVLDQIEAAGTKYDSILGGAFNKDLTKGKDGEDYKARINNRLNRILGLQKISASDKRHGTNYLSQVNPGASLDDISTVLDNQQYHDPDIGQGTLANKRRRQETRQENKENAALNFQITQLQNQMADSRDATRLANRKADLEERRFESQSARELRKDQQVALMAIIQGLAQMGNSVV
tara:strand:+ start:63 stop:893 length:831 start_codon:yes stop_codon:yes gene_type:complete